MTKQSRTLVFLPSDGGIIRIVQKKQTKIEKKDPANLLLSEETSRISNYNSSNRLFLVRRREGSTLRASSTRCKSPYIGCATPVQ